MSAMEHFNNYINFELSNFFIAMKVNGKLYILIGNFLRSLRIRSRLECKYARSRNRLVAVRPQ